jgi:hypothetical protein
MPVKWEARRFRWFLVMGDASRFMAAIVSGFMESAWALLQLKFSCLGESSCAENTEIAALTTISIAFVKRNPNTHDVIVDKGFDNDDTFIHEGGER